jgi:hypothetical protein
MKSGLSGRSLMMASTVFMKRSLCSVFSKSSGKMTCVWMGGCVRGGGVEEEEGPVSCWEVTSSTTFSGTTPGKSK